MAYLTFEQLEGKPNRSTILDYGPPKTGKTRACATLPRPIWFFDFDNGADACLTVARKEKWGSTDLVIFRYLPPGGDKVSDRPTRPRGREVFLSFIRDFNLLYDHIDPSDPTKWKAGPIVISDGNKLPPPQSIAFDGLSSFGDIVLDFVLNIGGHDLNAPKTDARADYGQQMGKIEECVVSSAGLPCNSVWTAHEVIEKDDTTAQIRCDPYVTGKLAARIARHFGVVLYSTVRGEKYMWQTRPEGYVKTAGTRFREGLPTFIDQNYNLVL